MSIFQIWTLFAIKFNCDNTLNIQEPNENTIWHPNTNVTLRWKKRHLSKLPIHVILLKLNDNITDTPYNRLLPEASQYLADPLYTNESFVTVNLNETLEAADKYFVRILYTNATDKEIYYSCSSLFRMESNSNSIRWTIGLALVFLIYAF
eukprot:NODE_338_length_10654_cov_0.207295.p5 type:complete len:150 gc:universal NODE_338_length_10654_cov_0.207295:1845-1396(-)